MSVPLPELTAEERIRLRQLIWFDVATACTAVAVMSLTYLAVVRNAWLLLLCVLVAASGVTMAAGLRPLLHGDLSGAVAWLAAANWSIALASTAIATFAWPLMVLAALLPAVFAAPYVAQSLLRVYVAVCLAVSVGVVALGIFQDVSGFTDALPGWLPPAVCMFFTPFLAGMVLVSALQHSGRLSAALAATTTANQALQASRVRLVTATDRERRRVERDLHDGAQQRLVALGMRLRAAQEVCRSDPDRAVTELGVLRDEVRTIHRELRDLAQGVYPPVLTQHGLGDALAAVADRCPVPVDLNVRFGDRHAPEIEATVYFCCVEALQNVVKHAGSDVRVAIDVSTEEGTLTFTIADDGRGFDQRAPAGTGLDNLRDRVGALGGTLDLRSAPGAGTIVAGRLPLVDSTSDRGLDVTT